LLIALTVLLIAAEAVGAPVLKVWAGLLGMGYLFCVAKDVRWSRRAFIIVGLVMAAFALAARPDGWHLVADALAAGAFVIGFFIALSTLRSAAGSSPSIRRCGLYLATRTPAKRYLALAMGGHLFSLVLNYGSISLLGALVEQAETDADGRIRNPARMRRMLMAIQRGFVSTLCWSPLAFSMAVGTTVIAGSSWGGAVGYGLVTSVVVSAVGWFVDAVFKPPRPANAPPPPQEGTIRSVIPLLTLLLSIMVCVAVGILLTGLRITMVVMAVVPLVSIAWVAVQNAFPATPEARVPSAAAEVGRRCLAYLGEELDTYKSEMVLLYMAGFIGKLGGALAAPLVTTHLLDLSAVPGWAVLVGLVCGLPLLGQIGMHPILAVSMIGPLLPAPDALGLSPDIVLVAMTVGWAFSGATSPFTATVLLVALFGRVSATTVGLRWNGMFLLLGCLVGSAWVLLLSLWGG